MWIFPLMMIAVMLVAIYLIFGQQELRLPWENFGRYQAGRNELETPLEIARKRYARGEISREELEQIERDLLN